MAEGYRAFERALNSPVQSDEYGGLGGREDGRMTLDSRVAAAEERDEFGGVRIGGGECVDVTCHMLEEGDVVDGLSLGGNDGRRRCSH